MKQEVEAMWKTFWTWTQEHLNPWRKRSPSWEGPPHSSQAGMQQPLHIHYEIHQHLHITQPNAYQQVLTHVTQGLPVTLQPLALQSARIIQRSSSQRQTLLTVAHGHGNLRG